MFWILVFSYWIHLLATAVWLVSVVAMAATAVPAFRQQQLTENGWLTLQKRLLPWANLSLVLLLLTGFVQMTNDTNYSGFLTFDSTWAWAMLVKHLFFLVVMAVAAYWQFGYFPAVERTAVLAAKKPQLAQAEQAKLARREQRLLWLNLACAVLILFCTAVLTAV
ncbi:MAG TPA: CopD family protein [Chloroflexota bacterium]|nr:CopD family protein [Chloroflexota bacterium]